MEVVEVSIVTGSDDGTPSSASSFKDFNNNEEEEDDSACLTLLSMF